MTKKRLDSPDFKTRQRLKCVGAKLLLASSNTRVRLKQKPGQDQDLETKTRPRLLLFKTNKEDLHMEIFISQDKLSYELRIR